MTLGDKAVWRGDIDSVIFAPPAHYGLCAVHLFAFRTLMGQLPTPDEALAFYRDHHAAFQRAAAAKIRGQDLGRDANFHLSSRDVRRAMMAG